MWLYWYTQCKSSNYPTYTNPTIPRWPHVIVINAWILDELNVHNWIYITWNWMLYINYQYNHLYQPYTRCVRYYYRFIRYEYYWWLKMFIKMIYMISWMIFFFNMIIILYHCQYVTDQCVTVYTILWENGSQCCSELSTDWYCIRMVWYCAWSEAVTWLSFKLSCVLC